MMTQQPDEDTGSASPSEPSPERMDAKALYAQVRAAVLTGRTVLDEIANIMDMVPDDEEWLALWSTIDPDDWQPFLCVLYDTPQRTADALVDTALHGVKTLMAGGLLSWRCVEAFLAVECVYMHALDDSVSMQAAMLSEKGMQLKDAIDHEMVAMLYCALTGNGFGCLVAMYDLSPKLTNEQVTRAVAWCFALDELIDAQDLRTLRGTLVQHIVGSHPGHAASLLEAAWRMGLELGHDSTIQILTYSGKSVVRRAAATVYLSALAADLQATALRVRGDPERWRALARAVVPMRRLANEHDEARSCAADILQSLVGCSALNAAPLSKRPASLILPVAADLQRISPTTLPPAPGGPVASALRMLSELAASRPELLRAHAGLRRLRLALMAYAREALHSYSVSDQLLAMLLRPDDPWATELLEVHNLGTSAERIVAILESPLLLGQHAGPEVRMHALMRAGAAGLRPSLSKMQEHAQGLLDNYVAVGPYQRAYATWLVQWMAGRPGVSREWLLDAMGKVAAAGDAMDAAMLLQAARDYVRLAGVTEEDALAVMDSDTVALSARTMRMPKEACVILNDVATTCGKLGWTGVAAAVGRVVQKAGFQLHTMPLRDVGALGWLSRPLIDQMVTKLLWQFHGGSHFVTVARHAEVVLLLEGCGEPFQLSEEYRCLRELWRRLAADPMRLSNSLLFMLNNDLDAKRESGLRLLYAMWRVHGSELMVPLLRACGPDLCVRLLEMGGGGARMHVLTALALRALPRPPPSERCCTQCGAAAAKMLLCTCDMRTPYCTAACQDAHWGEHRRKCLKVRCAGCGGRCKAASTLRCAASGVKFCSAACKGLSLAAQAMSCVV